MKKKIFILLFFLIIIVLMFINTKLTMEVTKNNINLLINSFIPSLLPYMIIISLFCELGGLEILGFFLQFIFSFLFRISGKSASLMIAGIVSGYPLPSVILSNKDYLNKEEEQVISIFVFPSLAFLINQIFPFLDNEYSGGRLLICFVIGAFVLLFFERRNTKEKVEYINISTLKKILINKYSNISFSSLWKKCIINSFINLCIISANVVIFSIIAALFVKIKPMGGFLHGILEFSGASIKTLPISSYLQYLWLLFILLWGGISILMQNCSLLAHTNFSIKNYIIYRIKLIIIVILIDFLIFF